MNPLHASTRPRAIRPKASRQRKSSKSLAIGTTGAKSKTHYPATKISVALAAGLLLLSLLPAPCLSRPDGASDQVSILTYNVQNLFDTQKDPIASDQTYLPASVKQNRPQHAAFCQELKYRSWQKECLKLDWNQKTLDTKLHNLAQVIGRTNADIILLQEVENANVLTQLVQKLPASQPYRSIALVEGTDTRGIDQALISRLPIIGTPRLHQHADLPKRGILATDLQLPDGQTLRVYVLHLPAPYHPRITRLKALRWLNLHIAQTIKQHPSTLILVGGDFNLTKKESSHPLIQAELAQWHQTHHSCNGIRCRGTYFYGRDRAWSWLDRLLILPEMANSGSACWQLDDQSVQLSADSPGQITKGGYPRKYSPHSGKGMSDHLPLYIELHRQC